MYIFGRSGFIRVSTCICVLIGICLGVALNMMITPFLDEMCDPINSKDTGSLLELQDTKMMNEQDVKELVKKSEDKLKAEDNLEKKIEKDVSENDFYIHDTQHEDTQTQNKKFVRPRFASTELGIREKLFVGVFSSLNTINSFGMALNKSFGHYVTKTVFFTSGKSGVSPPGMQVVGFSGLETRLLPIHALKYVKEHYQNTFDYYLFITDRTYIRGEKLYEFVSHISVSEEVHMGAAVGEEDSDICSIEAGIILSQGVLAKVFQRLDTCLLLDGQDTSHMFENCIAMSHTRCSTKRGDKVYRSYKLDDFEYDDDIAVLRGDATFNSSFSVYPMPDDISIYKIHRYFCQLELNLTRQEIQKAKDSIIDLSEFSPGGRESLQWPIGVPEGFKPNSRFDIIQWTYFTDTHIYFEDDFTNISPLQGADKEDIQEIQQKAFERLNKVYEDRYKQFKLVNGYRRFEPTRGMEYTLDLELYLKQRQEKPDRKRVHLLRPMGKVEIIPMPYVTENTRIHLVLPLYENEVNDFSQFMEGFTNTVLETNDNSYLYVIFVHNLNSAKTVRDPFAVPKQVINYHLNNHPSHKGKVSWKVLQVSHTEKLEVPIIDFLSRDFTSNDLICLCSVAMEMNIDYLNRVRMNTIQNVQVFYPISFWQYKQNLIYEETPYPPGVELGQKFGHFDRDSYEHCSFYLSDYSMARRHVLQSEVNKLHLIDLFLKLEKIHVFRASEPSLRIRWHHLECETTSIKEDQSICEKRKSESLASRSQLAKSLFDYTDKKHSSVESVLHSVKEPNS